MISDRFIDQCLQYTCSLDESEHSFSKDFYSSLGDIIAWYLKNVEENKYDSLPTDDLNKLKLLKMLTKEKLNKGLSFDFNNFLDRIQDGMYSKFIPLVIDYMNFEVDEDKFHNFFIQTILPKQQYCTLVNDKDELSSILEKLTYGNFEDYTYILNEFRGVIEKYHKNITTAKQLENMNTATTLDLGNDDYTPTLQRFKDNFNMECSVKTGFDCLDSCFPHGGFEKRRIYLFGGESGVGKSILLQNIMAHFAKFSKKQTDEDIKDERLRTIVFFSAENLIDESLIRFYCCLTDTPQADVISLLREDPNFKLEQEIKEVFQKSGVNIIFHYVQPKITKPSDLETLMEGYYNKYKIEGIMLDYLDLLTSTEDEDILRHKLGDITISLKRMAITFDCPVISVTQINSRGYGGKEISLTCMSESMQKVHNSDFIAYLQKIDESNVVVKPINEEEFEATVVKVTVLKNRNGPINSSFRLLLKTRSGDRSIFSYKFEEQSPTAQIRVLDLESGELREPNSHIKTKRGNKTDPLDEPTLDDFLYDDHQLDSPLSNYGSSPFSEDDETLF